MTLELLGFEMLPIYSFWVSVSHHEKGGQELVPGVP